MAYMKDFAGRRLDSFEATTVGGPIGDAIFGAIRAGRSAAVQVQSDSTGDAEGEWVYLLAQKFAEEFSNLHVRYKVWSDASQDHGAWVILQEGDGERYANFASGARSMWLPAAEFSSTGDLDIRVRLSLDDWTPGSTMTACGKWGSAGQYQWTLNVATTGQLQFRWSSDGTFVQQVVGSALGFTDGATKWIRGTLLRNNGSGGYTAKTYHSDDGVTWTENGSIATSSGATSVYSSTATYEIGGQGFSAQVLRGKIYEVQIRDGVDGRVLNPQPIDSWTPRPGSVGGSPYVAGSFGGGPTLYIVNSAMAGSTSSYHYGSPRHDKEVQPYLGSVIFQSISHNDADNIGGAYISARESWIDTTRTRVPAGQVVIIAQNPQTSPGSPIDEVAKHSRRLHLLRGIAARKAVPLIDVDRAFREDPRGLTALVADGVHPTSAGSVLWRDAVWAAIAALR